MKLYMKQKVFSWTAKYTVKDEHENDRYYIEGEFMSMGRKLSIKDSSGHEIARVEQKVFSFMPKFKVYINGQHITTIVKKFTFFRPSYVLENTDLVLDGDIFNRNFSLLDNGRVIMTFYKEWFTWGDSYVIDIDDHENEIIALAIALAVDCVLDASKNND